MYTCGVEVGWLFDDVDLRSWKFGRSWIWFDKVLSHVIQSLDESDVQVRDFRLALSLPFLGGLGLCE